MSLAYVMGRFWSTIFPLARAQLRAWERAACAIPDPELREHALATLRSEGLSAMGAALVATTAARYDPALVRLLVALQIAWDYIDTLSEQPSADPVANGVQLHRALIDAVAPEAEPADYYRFNRARDDGGYLAALVAHCRAACTELPAHGAVSAAAVRELRRAEVQYVNNLPEAERAPTFRRWAERQDSIDGDAGWIELAAAASSSLGVLAMLASAADPATTEADVERIWGAYMPWIDALTALLDSFVDHAGDVAGGLMNWIEQYPSPAVAALRIQQVTLRAMLAARRLPRPERHVVIVAGMAAMHLSQASAREPGAQPAAAAVLRATGTPVTQLLLILLRAWRLARRAPAGAAARDDQPAPRPTGQLTPVPPSPQ